MTVYSATILGDASMQDLGNGIEDGQSARGSKRKEREGNDELISMDIVKKTRFVDSENPVQEVLGEDMFLINYRVKEVVAANLMEKLMAAGLMSREAKACKEVSLKDYQYAFVEKLAETKSDKVASLTFILFKITRSGNFSETDGGKKIIGLAQKIIARVPDRQREREEREYTLEVARACESLGWLVAAVDSNKKGCAALIRGDFGADMEKIREMALGPLRETKSRINSYTKKCVATPLQDVNESVMIYVCLEVAKALLLSSGHINFGLWEIICDRLIPSAYKNSSAARNIENKLCHIVSTPSIMETVYETQVPDPGNIVSDLAIRSLLDIPIYEKLTDRDAKLFILSGLLAHFRQANAGTCFATSVLIKAFDHQLDYVANDFRDITENGDLVKKIFHEYKSIPFRPIISNEYLYKVVKTDRDGRVISIRDKAIPPYKHEEEPLPQVGSLLSDSPGIRSACAILGLDPETAVVDAIPAAAGEFTAKELLDNLALAAYTNQEKETMWLRGRKRFSLEELVQRVRYAYCSKTNHPLHRAYEQINAAMTEIFSSQYTWPAYVHQTMEEVLERKLKRQRPVLQTAWRRLLQEMFLPMITRMKYGYCHNFDDYQKLFPDSAEDIKSYYNFGYVLYDSGLPKNFYYSTCLYKDYRHKASAVTLERFYEYEPPDRWKKIDSGERFVEFIVDIINKTVDYLIKTEEKRDKLPLWDEVRVKMEQKVRDPGFITEMVVGIFGRGYSQKREFLKKGWSISSVPWKFRWGGFPNDIMEIYYGVTESPFRLKRFNGTQKEVLAKCMNFMRGQPEHIKQDLLETGKQIVVESPGHAFLLLPTSDSFLRAWQSDLPAEKYIDKFVMGPGMEVAHQMSGYALKRELVEFVADNLWVSPYEEKPDFKKLQLTAISKSIFDQEISSLKPGAMRADEFIKKLLRIVAAARAGDPKIGKRNAYWEGRFASLLRNRAKALGIGQGEEVIDREKSSILINFVRDRKDTLALSGAASNRFRSLAGDIPNNLRVCELRKRLCAVAMDARKLDVGEKDKAWLATLTPHLDSKLFSLLPKSARRKAISSGIVTHDTNWKAKIDDLYFIFMVNPATAALEMAICNRDLDKVKFMNQDPWFPQGANNIHECWFFPDNFRCWSDAPPIKISDLSL